MLVSSIGVERYTQFPFAVLNAFGALKYKYESEQKLVSSGLSYSIVRPGKQAKLG